GVPELARILAERLRCVGSDAGMRDELAGLVGSRVVQEDVAVAGGVALHERDVTPVRRDQGRLQARAVLPQELACIAVTRITIDVEEARIALVAHDKEVPLVRCPAEEVRLEVLAWR